MSEDTLKATDEFRLRRIVTPEGRRLLVQMHYPISLACMLAISKAVAKSYPGTTIDESGGVWSADPEPSTLVMAPFANPSAPS